MNEQQQGLGPPAIRDAGYRDGYAAGYVAAVAACAEDPEICAEIRRSVRAGALVPLASRTPAPRTLVPCPCRKA
jgi:hypothetical protein